MPAEPLPFDISIEVQGGSIVGSVTGNQFALADEAMIAGAAFRLAFP